MRPTAQDQSVFERHADPSIQSERAKLERATRLHWAHWAIIIFSLALTYAAWQFSKNQVEARVGMQFDRESSQVLELVAERMQKYEDALWGGVALHHASHEVEYPEWVTYAESLSLEQKYQGVNGIGVIYAVEPDHLDEFEKTQRTLRPDFTIYPEHHQAESLPITYIEPVEVNRAAVGLDMAHESNRYTAAKQARQTGTAQITGPIVLVQDEDKTPGFLFYAPFYTDGTPNDDTTRMATFEGLVYAPFVVKRLMRGTLDKANRHVGIRLTDADEVIYDELQPGENDFDPKPMFTTSSTIPMYGRAWKFDVWASESFREAQKSSQPIFILIGGIIIDSVIIALFFLLSRGNRNALDLADAVTEDLRVSNEDLAQSEERLGLVISGSSDGYWDWDLNGDMWFSPRFEELLGIDPGTLEHESDEFRSRLHPEESGRVLAEINASIANGDPLDVEHRMRIHTGEFRWFRTRARVIHDDDDNPVRMSGSTSDIHARRVAEEALRANEAKLEDKNRELEQFVYTASHDLKSPIVTILGYAGHLLKDIQAQRHDELEEFGNRIARAAERMRANVDDLLELSRVGRTNTEAVPVELNSVTSEIWETLTSQLKKTITLERSFEVETIEFNLVQARQLIQNLLENAIKYGCPDDSGTVRIGTEISQDSLTLYVRDFGPGIEPEHRERVFGLFERLSPDKNGTGIGLAIVKRITELNQGRVELTAGEHAIGALFRVHLPRRLAITGHAMNTARCQHAMH